MDTVDLYFLRTVIIKTVLSLSHDTYSQYGHIELPVNNTISLYSSTTLHCTDLWLHGLPEEDGLSFESGFFQVFFLMTFKGVFLCHCHICLAH